jgi:hypothetical protein
MNTLNLDPEAARRFLSALGYDLERPIGLELRLIGNGKQVLWPEPGHPAWPQVEAANKKGANVYFGVCPRRDRKGDATHTIHAPALWVDLDGKKYDAADHQHGKALALERLRRALPAELQPSILVDSGNGFHCYWHLVEPWEFSENGSRPRFEATLRALAEYLQGDTGVADAARIMRLPGTLNVKDPANPLPCLLLECDPERRFNPSDFDAYFTPAPVRQEPTPTQATPTGERRKPARATMDFLASGAPEGERNDRAFKAACDLAGCGYPQDETLTRILDAARKCGLPEDEARHAVASAYSKPRIPARPAEPPPEELDYHPFTASQVPELPKEARLPADLVQAGREVGRWLDDYLNYADARSPLTPALFHESAGLWLIGVAIARRLCLNLAHATVYPNLFVLWSAPTTLYAKSTGLDIAESLAQDTIPYLLLPQETTPEALMTEMAGREPSGLHDLPENDRDLWVQSRNFAAQRGMILDEASALFSSFRRDYNTGLIEALIRLYDCKPLYKRVTRGQGFLVVRDAALAFLGATTPAALQRIDTDHLWQAGLWPRFTLLTPEREPTWRQSEERQRPDNLTTSLRQLAKEYLSCPVYPDRPQSRSVAISPDAFSHWQAYDKAMRYDLLRGDNKPDGRLWGIYGRLPTQAIKIAICLAAIDWTGDGAPEITATHWARAQAIAERWRASAHRLLDALSTVSPETDLESRIEQLIRQSGEITARDLQRLTHQRRDAIDVILERLRKDGLLVEVERKGKRGPATRAYRWLEENP